jgi:hypothetical protein
MTARLLRPPPQVLKHNGALLPPAALFIIRYHSFYALHQHGAYQQLLDEQDRQLLPWLVGGRRQAARDLGAPSAQGLRPAHNSKCFSSLRARIRCSPYPAPPSWRLQVAFQKLDLYSKTEERLDVAQLKPYYMGLIEKWAAQAGWRAPRCFCKRCSLVTPPSARLLPQVHPQAGARVVRRCPAPARRGCSCGCRACRLARAAHGSGLQHRTHAPRPALFTSAILYVLYPCTICTMPGRAGVVAWEVLVHPACIKGNLLLATRERERGRNRAAHVGDECAGRAL